jgi:hypothetical protein
VAVRLALLAMLIALFASIPWSKGRTDGLPVDEAAVNPAPDRTERTSLTPGSVSPARVAD